MEIIHLNGLFFSASTGLKIDKVFIMIPAVQYLLMSKSEVEIIDKLKVIVESIDVLVIECVSRFREPQIEYVLYKIIKFMLRQFKVKRLEYTGGLEASHSWPRYRKKILNMCFLFNDITIEKLEDDIKVRRLTDINLADLGLFKQKCYRHCDFELTPLTIYYSDDRQFEHDRQTVDDLSSGSEISKIFNTLNEQVMTFLLIAKRLNFHKDPTRIIASMVMMFELAELRLSVHNRSLE